MQRNAKSRFTGGMRQDRLPWDSSRMGYSLLKEAVNYLMIESWAVMAQYTLPLFSPQTCLSTESAFARPLLFAFEVDSFSF